MQVGERAGLLPGEQLRKAFGQALLEVTQENPKIIVLDGDLGNSTGGDTVRKAFPERFFNMGIAESNLVGVGAGLAANGYIPFMSSLASFLWFNAFDQIRLAIAIPSLNAKLVGSHSGLTTGREGPSSMSLEDLALACALPTFTVLVPCDEASMHAAVRAAVTHVGPVYIRSSREALPHVYATGACPFSIGKANVLRTGSDVTLIAYGLMVPVALDAAAILAEDGIRARVLDMHTVRPLDSGAIEAAAHETGAIVTAEEQLVGSGMGNSVARIVAECCPVPMRFIGVHDAFGVSASLPELMEKFGMTARHVVGAALDAIAAKGRQSRP